MERAKKEVVRHFERLAVEFLDASCGGAPETTISLIHASPLSARNPDVCLLWHDGYRKKHRVGLLLNLISTTLYGLLKGAVKLAVDYKPMRYSVHGKITDSLLVLASTCGFESPAGTFKTAYVRTEDDDALFVCGPAGTCGKGEKDVDGLTLAQKLAITLRLTRSGLRAFFTVKGDFIDKALLLLLWLEWTLSLQWLHACYLERALSEVVEGCRVKKVGCIHEMHSYARVVWRVAAKYNARGYAVQHASISSGKKWYFSHPAERKNGLMLPDVMHAFSDDTVKLLAPHYDATRFILGCSSRFSHWKDAAPDRTRKSGYYLFATALASFDNDVMIEAVRTLVENSAAPIHVRLRLHPYAEIKPADKKWLKSRLQAGLIDVSRDIALKDDIARSEAVIGMSTTVLEEALLLGCPAIQLTHPDYLQYMDLRGIQGAAVIDSGELSAGLLAALSRTPVNCEPLRERLGLNHPTVTYQNLFKP